MLERRFVILKDSEQIDQATLEYLRKMTKYIEEKTGKIPTEEKGGMLFTHLALAISRHQKGELCGDMDEMVKEQLEKKPLFCQAKNLWQEMSKACPINFAPQESDFMIMHLIAYLSD